MKPVIIPQPDISMRRAKGLSLINQVLYLIFLVSLICSFRAIASIAIALIFVAGVITSKWETGNFFHPRIRNPFLVCCFFLFLLSVTGLFYATDKQAEWKIVLLSSGLLFVPLAICSSGYINRESRERLMRYYCFGLIAASLFCLGHAVSRYRISGDISVFFYHSLVSLFHQHAVYYSVLVFIGLAFLFETALKNRFLINRWIHFISIVFLSLFLFLLSSKLVLVFYLVYLVYHFILLVRNRTSDRWLIIGSFVLLVTICLTALMVRNPVSDRFYDVFHGDLSIIKQDKFNSGHYFNGVQFRLLQWEFTAEILSEHDRWWYGVSPASSQEMLDQKYISKNMYAGDPAKGTHGYLGYNTHNQFLETLLQSGITGLVVLLAACFYLVKMAWQKKSRILSTVVTLFLVWMFTESVLGTQYGIMIFCFFPLFFSFD